MNSHLSKITIIQDTREQYPLDFRGYEGVSVKVKECWPGDYTLYGLPRKFAIERKSVSDLLGTMMHDYAGFTATTPKRFDRTLLGLRAIIALGGYAAVIVEPDDMPKIRRCGYNGDKPLSSERQISLGYYRSTISPLCVMAFVRTIRNAWGIPVILASRREHAAEILVSMARLVDVVGKPPKKVTDGLSKLMDMGKDPPPKPKIEAVNDECPF